MTTKKNRIQFFIYILGTIIISVCVSNWLANKSNLYIKILMPKGGVTDPERQSRDTTKMSVADPFSNLMNSALHARTLLPEVHITIASVIQGATIVIIAEKIYSNSSLLAQGSLLDVLTFSTYAFASFLISILFWTRFIHGALLTYRSLTYVSNSIFFLLAISQMLTFYNAIANNGKMVKPKFIHSIRLHGNTEKIFRTEVINPSICSRRTLSKVREALEGVVENGTAKNLRNENFKIAGKTGTAQIARGVTGYRNAAGVSHQASFVGYFPADNPKFSCIVVVNSPSRSVYYGNLVAGPIFKEIADKVHATNPDWFPEIVK